MSYYKTCPYCEAHLDPGEHCTCIDALYQLLTPEERKLVNNRIQELLAEQKQATA